MDNSWIKMRDDEYHLRTELSSSLLRRFMRSPYGYQRSLSAVEKRTPALEFGNAVHLAILQPDEFGNSVLMAPEADGRTTEGKLIKARFMAGLTPGTLVLKRDDYHQACAMAQEITAAEEFKQFSARATGVELAGFANVKGVECRIKPDLLGDDFLLDYKSTVSCTPRAFERSILTYGYVVQLAFYRMVAYVIDGKQRNNVFILAQEKKPPYEWMIYQLDLPYLNEATKQIVKALDKFAICKAFNDWPKLPKSTQLVSIPGWYDGSSPLYGESDEEENTDAE